MNSATWQPSRLHQPAHVDSPRPARPPIWTCPNPVAASHPTRGITLRNAPRRNPTCATVSPHRAPRTCGPARRRDGSSRQARAEPRASRIDRNRRESTGVECVCAGASARGISLRNVPKRNPVNFRDLTHEFTLDFRDFLSNNPLDFRDLMHEFTLDFRDLH